MNGQIHEHVCDECEYIGGDPVAQVDYYKHTHGRNGEFVCVIVRYPSESSDYWSTTFRNEDEDSRQHMFDFLERNAGNDPHPYLATLAANVLGLKILEEES